MVVVGELEGLVNNHNLLISRGSIVEAGKIKNLILGYLSQKDTVNRLYKPLRAKFEEFIFCAETNFNRFREIINYKQLTQMEYFYPEYFMEFGKDIKNSGEKMIQSGNQLYAGLLLASTFQVERQNLLKYIEHFVMKKNYLDLERMFERLAETRQMILNFDAEAGKTVDVPLISDEEVSQKIGKLIFEAYSEETKNLETQGSEYSSVKNAYKLANILSFYLPELGLITDSSLVSTGTIYFKEIARRVDIDNTAELIRFLEHFKQNPATKRFASENPGMFQNYIDSPDVRDVLCELVRKLLGKTKFDETNRLADSLEGIISFSPVFKDHLTTLKENRFFVQAIEMAERLHLKEEITDDLKLEAFRKLLEDFGNNPVKSALQRLRKFCAKYKISAQNYPEITNDVLDRLEFIEKINPEISKALDDLYAVLQLERRVSKFGNIAFGKLFEPIIWFFSMIFKVFLRLIITIATRQVPKGAENSGKGSK
ncbi:MAG TPA: hypothetical protein VM123_18245 [archaeon]|nr:hypothetical protein [archaeon]